MHGSCDRGVVLVIVFFFVIVLVFLECSEKQNEA
jgi:hypothetical protein